jgi:hypothetical protein
MTVPFDLYIDFTGVCTFVHDTPNSGPERVHVLLPGPIVGHDAHAARLRFDSVYAGGPAGVPHDHPLENALLDLGGIAGSLSYDPPDELAVVGSETRKVKRNRLTGGGTNPRDILARITLGAGAFACRKRGVFFDYRGDPDKELTNLVRWKIPGIERDRLELVLDKLRGPNPTQPPTLFPKNGRIELAVLHVPHVQLDPNYPKPNPPIPRTPSHHFASHFRVFDHTDEKVPLYVRGDVTDVCHPVGKVMAAGVTAMLGGDPFMCMPSTTLAEPT